MTLNSGGLRPSQTSKPNMKTETTNCKIMQERNGQGGGEIKCGVCGMELKYHGQTCVMGGQSELSATPCQPKPIKWTSTDARHLARCQPRTRQHPSTREIKATLRTQAELCEVEMPHLDFTTQMIRKHQALCLRAALKRISRA